ncbi:MAG: helix-turn-helix domain-containing protein [bacterium]
MKTAGQLLCDKRLEKGLTIDDVARRLKVRPEYLVAVESNNYSVLPGNTAAKGFLRNYARALYLNPDTILAMFRRDFDENEKGQIIPKGTLTPLSRKPRLISANLILISVGILTFLAFLGWQIFSWLSLPKLEVYSPINGEVYVGKVSIRGKTDLDATITINNQKVLIDQTGNFNLDLVFPPGTHSVLLQAESRANKLRLVERTFQIIE